MGVVLMNIAKCALRGVTQALQVLFGVQIPPEDIAIIRESIDIPRVTGTDEEYVTYIRLKHEQLKGSGFVIVKIPKKNAKAMMKKAGLSADVTDEEAVDACGEFSNLVAGSFKVEMNTLGRGLINIDVPKKYPNGVEKVIDDVKVFTKYVLSVPYKNEILLNVEVAFGSAEAYH